MPSKRKQDQATSPAKRAKHNSKNAVTDDKKPTTFLDLPAELRNDIYEMALIEKSSIKVTPKFKEPALLSTSRQIRSETQKIWYLRNTFEIRVHDCNANLAVAFQKHAMQFEDKSKDGAELDLVHDMTGRKVWWNLENWCYEIFKDGLDTWKPEYYSDRRDSVVCAAFQIVQATRSGSGGSWSDCLRALDALRYAVGNLDEAWLVN